MEMTGPGYDGKRWGSWQYCHATLTLELRKGRELIYWVDLRRCNDSADILDWILQVSQKVDVVPADIGHLVRALDELGGGLQGQVCPGGGDHPFDFGSFLRGKGSVK